MQALTYAILLTLFLASSAESGATNTQGMQPLHISLLVIAILIFFVFVGCCAYYQEKADKKASSTEKDELREITIAALRKPGVSDDVHRYLNTVEYDLNASRRLNVHGRDWKQRTPLIAICDVRRCDLNCSQSFLFECVVDLINSGADIFAVDAENRTARDAARALGYHRIAGFLEGLMNQCLYEVS
ncbi:hypothetical protein QR680_015377 [Steinernema hermaphroditum]|uniref:Uncharacterized protein n=1 Tax=Steinernema hermaphroditum TaxID=289476 RepID=A0AA39H8H9_9BILA|nr:hypothetical protein QR680_015377 [Steinernema hermaphroditum]